MPATDRASSSPFRTATVPAAPASARARAGVLGAVLVLAAAAAAQSGPPPIPADLRARFGFDGPLVVKVGEGLGNLQVADVDGDGQLEVVALDPRRARLVAVAVRDRQAQLRSLPTNGQVAGYTVADVHGDRKPDLLLVDARGRLTVRAPGGEATTAPLDLGLQGRNVGLLPGDLDGDGCADVVALGRGAMRSVTRLGTTPLLGPLEPCEENTWSFHVADLDGDTKLDLVAVVPGPNMNLRLRQGRGDGTFGPWRIFSRDDLHDAFPAKTADGHPALATIAGPSRAVSLLALRPSDGQPALHWWAHGENTTGKTLPWALGDVDGDGDEDLVVARPDRAQLAVYEWRDDTFVPRTLPTLAGVTGVVLGDVDRDGRTDTVLVSPEEDAVAWVTGAGPLDRFPEQLAVTDKPVAVAVDPAGGVLVLARTDKRDAAVWRCAPGQPAARVLDVGRLPADPARLFAGEFGDGPGLELAFVVPGEGLRTLSLGAANAESKATGKAADRAATKATDTAGFTKKLDDGAVTALVHAGQPALLAVRERFARTFRLDENGQVRVLAQDNGPDGTIELALAADLHNDTGAPARCFLDRKANKLAIVAADGAIRTVDVPAFDFSYVAGHRGASLLLSARGVLRVTPSGGHALHPIAVHEPPLLRTAYSTGRPGDFDHDGIQDLVVLDHHLPGVQVLAGGRDGLQRALAVPVFETPPSDEPDREPRELAVGDLDGDGRCDLVLIAHDRILIYPQEP